MESLYQEYLTNHGTIVKPYYWLALTLDCSKCPYHIQTGEEARVTHTEFYQIFGFPCGPSLQTKHLIFYELKTSSGSLVQKGHASSCSEYDTHPESMLFEMGSYLEAFIQNNDNIEHILLYSNYSPCNEANHCCISKMYNFLMRYPGISLNIYFSQLYHTDTDFPVSAWNREALRSLASLWPQVTLNPISGGIWHFLLYHFVSDVSGTMLYQPLWPARALADRHNAYEIKAITGVKPYFTDVLPHTTMNPDTKAQLDLQRWPSSNVSSLESSQVMNNQPPPLMMAPEHRMPVIFMVLPFREQQLPNETKDPTRAPTGRLGETVEMTEQFSSGKEVNVTSASRLSPTLDIPSPDWGPFPRLCPTPGTLFPCLPASVSCFLQASPKSGLSQDTVLGPVGWCPPSGRTPRFVPYSSGLCPVRPPGEQGLGSA
ncbi:putative C-_U-editing enzyme APOBEC-4 isoform X3 [Notamacropus eugenii]|uniref:putative C->U-editing enzyme APOBEC-4 isoform X3 n=1 Tax=Notamacropus eugenii TaxID=9315 RepID=UPI003B66F2C5